MTQTSAGSFYRTIVAVKRCTDGADITLDCGHVSRANQIYSYKIGARYRCYRCEYGKEPFHTPEPLTGQLMEQLP